MPDNAAAALAVVIYLAALDAADSVVASAAVSVVAHAMALASSRMSRSRMATLRCTLVDRVAVLEVMAVLVLVLVAGREEPVLVLALQAMAAVLELVAGKEVPVSVADAALAVMAVVQELEAAGKAVLVADAVLAAMAVVLAGRELELELVLAPMPGDHRLSSTIP